MPLRRLLFLPILYGVLCWPAALFADKLVPPMITVEDAFARASIPGMPMAAAFLQIRNKDKVEHLITGASSPVATNVELHGHVEVGGMMRMRQMQHIHLKPGAVKTLKPGGLHVMLIGLKRALVEGETLSLTLELEDGRQMTLSVPIKSRTANYP